MILLDGRALQTPSAVRGIGTYVRGLLSGFLELGAPLDIELLLTRGRPDPPEVKAPLRAASARIAAAHPTLQPVLDPLLVARALRRLSPRLYHAVEWGQPLTPGRTPVVITVHDLISFIFPRDYPWVRRSHLGPLRLLRRADRIIAVSQSTAADLLRIAHVDPSRLVTIPEGVADVFDAVPREQIAAVRARHGLGRPYVLAVGTFDPRKRIQTLASTVRKLAGWHDVDLVIAGDQGTFGASVLAALAREGITARSHVIGHVTTDDLAALYAGSLCLLFTSAYEGFGLPPLEAMRCGTGVVMFRNSSLTEIAGPAALLVPDGDAEAMARAAAALIGDTAERSRRIGAGREWSRGFTWRRTAERTLAVYEDAMARRDESSA